MGTRLYGGSAYAYALCAMGLIDLVISTGLKPWDYIPRSGIIEAAGGKMTNWQGGALKHDQEIVIASLNPELHQAALDLMAS